MLSSKHGLQVDWKAEENLPTRPRLIGTKVYEDYPLEDIVDYIDWNPFFQVMLSYNPTIVCSINIYHFVIVNAVSILIGVLVLWHVWLTRLKIVVMIAMLIDVLMMSFPAPHLRCLSRLEVYAIDQKVVWELSKKMKQHIRLRARLLMLCNSKFFSLKCCKDDI